MRTPSSIVPFVLATFLAASACTGGTHEGAASIQGTGGTLRLVLVELGGAVYPEGSYDPLQNNYPPAQELARCCLYRTLMSYNGRPTSEGGAVPRPDLAARPPDVSPDRRTWTFTIRRGIHYAPPLQHVEVTAGDFIRALERAWSPAPPALTKATGQRLLGGEDQSSLSKVDMIQGARAFAFGTASTVSGLEAPDRYTLRIRLTQPRSDFDYLFSDSQTAPLPPNPARPGAKLGVAEGHDTNYGNGFQVGTGPYMLQGAPRVDFSRLPEAQVPASGAASDSITLVRNPSWDRTTDPLRAAYADRILIVGAKDFETGQRMVEQGKADLVLDAEAPPDVVDRYQASPALRGRVFVDSFDTTTILALNLAVPPLDDLHVRRALNFAIDKSAMVRPFHVVANTTPATHIGIDSQEGNLLVNYAPYGTGQGDLEAARREMALSKYDRDRNGTCDAAACRAVHIVLKGSAGPRIEQAKLIRDDLAPLGIHLFFDLVSDQDFFHAANEPAPGQAMVLVVIGKSLPTASTFFSSDNNFAFSLLGMTSAQLRHRGFQAGATPDISDRVDACLREVFTAQIRCWADLDVYLMEEVVPWAPLLAWTVAHTVSARVSRFSFDQSISQPTPAVDRIAVALVPGASATP